MSLFGDIGNIFHSIGHFFAGGDDNNQNTGHPVSAAPVAPHPAPGPVYNNAQNTPFQSNSQNPQKVQPQQAPVIPGLNLYQGPSHAPQAGSFDPNAPLNKVAPQPSAQPAQPQPSIIHQIENGAKNVGEALGGAATAVPLGVLRTGEGLVQGVTDLPDLATHALTYLPRKLAGDDSAVNRGLSTVNRGVDTATHVIDAPQKWLENKTDQAVGMFGPDNTATNTAEALYKPTQVAANVATLLPAATAVAGKVGEIGNLSKVIDTTNAVNKFVDAQRAASPAMQALDKVKAGIVDQVHADWNPEFEANKVGTATDTKVATGIQAPDEVAVGLKSANPNQGADALQAIQEREAQAATLHQGQATPPVDTPSAAMPTTPQTQPTLQSTAPAPSDLPPTLPEPQTPSPASPQAQPVLPKVSSSESPVTPNNVAQTPTDVNPNTPTASNAPKIIDSINKEIASNNPGDVHAVMEKQAMAQRALQQAQTTDLPTAITQHSTTRPVVQTPQDAMDATALMRRMYAEAKDDPAAKVARDNLANAVAEYGSHGGQAVNVMKDVTAGLPPDAKASVMAKTLGKIWKDDPNRPDLLKSDSGQAHLEDTLTKMLEQSEAHNNSIAQLEGQIEALGHDPANIDQMHELGSQLNDLRLRSAIDNGEAGRFISSLLPPKSNWEKVADWARTSMLSSVGGRLNNLANVGSNTAYETATSLVQSQLNKVFNQFLGDSSKLSDVSLLNRGAFTGVKTGMQKVGAEFSGKSLSSTPVEKLIKGGETDAYGMPKINGNKGFFQKATNIIHAAVNTPKNIFGQSAKDSQLVRLARQDGLQQGLTGGKLDAYTTMRSYVPPRQMEAKGQELMDQVSHTNKNWLATKVGSWMEGSHIENSALRGVVGLVRNTILPFAKYPATYLWNTIGDRNLIADAARFGTSLKNGDMEGVTKALSRAVVDGTLGATGWHLATSGIITTKDGDGYSDGGMYLHFGNRYIPLGLLGVVGEPLLGGAALATALHSGGNALDNFGKALVSTAVDTVKLGGAQSLVGADNQALSTVQNAVGGKNGVTPVDAAAQTGAQAAGQFIPGALSDVNAFLNHSPLNPTGEATLTKVTKGDSGTTTQTGAPSKAKDIPATAVNQLANRIPVLSQSLPRNPGTTAPDVIDRVTRGTHVGTAQADALQKANAPGSPNEIKARLAADRATFVKSNTDMQTINGKTWANIDGTAKPFDTPLHAQQALDEAKFKAGSQDFQQKNGMVYQRGSNGKVTPMEQKDYDYKQASDQITSAKNSGDVTGYTEGHQKLLGNIGWQLAHADLTSAQRDQLTQRAVQAQEDFAKVQQYGGFTKPKDAPAYATPQITGAKDGYVRAIQEAGAKYGVDINALLSVAAQEGLGGGVGDNGTSFGPFQMHQGGALPPGKDQKWAESPEGIDYAVQQIANVAKGKIGPEAIKAIVTQFEKSADQPGEIARALELYTGGKATLSPGAAGGSGVSITPSDSSTASAQKAADLVKQNKIGSLPVMARESFINDMSSRPVPLNLPQVKLTSPGSLIKAHKITVGMPKA